MRGGSYIVRNLTKGNVVAARARMADSFFSRFRGLMFTLPLEEEEALILTPCNSIHMFFMFYSIDALFIDEGGRVLRVRERLWPFVSLCLPVSDARTVIELRAGRASAVGVEAGDILEWERTS